MDTLRQFLFTFTFAGLLCAQGNGKLQLHFVDVGQGDGALVISPNGQVAAFDIGQDLVSKTCDKPEAYYEQLGISSLAYLFVSHYHQDHIGCVPALLRTVSVASVQDRGKNYPSSYYNQYVQAIGNKRHTALLGDQIVLDQGSTRPVTINIFEVNAQGLTTTNENDLSLAARITYGGFHAEIGGDLSGDNTEHYIDVESTVANAVGKLDLYKIHHHCSSHSSNDAWLAATTPTVGIISTGTGNTYTHPAPDCLERLHKAGTHTYWTEQGSGGDPVPGWDVVAGDIVVQVDLGTNQYTVQHGATTDTYQINGGPVDGTTPSHAQYAWSKRSKVYHYATCDFVKSISPDNLERGGTPPGGKTLHQNCPLNHH